ncbi:MAG: 16S rRNA (cytosine(1402)-N(4))-methyltransferase RsmH [Planctomycetia bacterium]|jgi:16S rRNA (cytosine1402-N4)-methyltransferase
MQEDATVHVPVLLGEVIESLMPSRGKIIVDGTLGGGGHTRALAEKVGPDGLIISVDRDPIPVERANRTMEGLPVRTFQANFSDIPEVLAEMNLEKVDGVLLDLGLSSDQLADDERGFSFSSDGPLDLRFDTSQGEPTWRLINRLSPENLADLIYAYGEERHSRRIARAIVKRREESPIRTTVELAEVVRRAVPRSRDSQRIDPATRTFQALRIAANDELKSLEIALRRIPDCLISGGRVAIISFHSLEDRRVKEAFREDDRYEVITRRPIRASEEEIASNPRSRSAKLRVASRVAED